MMTWFGAFLYIAVLALLGFAGCSEAQDAFDGNLKLGFLYPLTNHGSGAQRAAGGILALEHVNARNFAYIKGERNTTVNFPPGFRMSFVVNDTARDPAAGLEMSMYQTREAGVHGIVGAASSSVSEPVQWICTLTKTPQISYASTAAKLSNRELFPFFMRTVPPDSVQGVAIARLMRGWGWTQVATISSSDAYAVGVTQEFRNEAKKVNLTVIASQTFPEKNFDRSRIRTALQAIRDSKTHVILCATTAGDAQLLFETAYEEGLIQPKYQWVGVDGIMQSFLYSSNRTIFEAMRGIVGIIPDDGKTTPNYRRFVNDAWSKETPQRFTELELKGVQTLQPDDFQNDPNQFTPYSYDAVWSHALAASKMMREGRDPRNGPELMEELLKLDFDGLTGPISFDINGDRLGQYAVLNLQNVESSGFESAPPPFVNVGTWSTASGFVPSDSPILWSTGSRVPIDVIPIPVVLLKPSTWTVVLLVGMCGIMIIISIAIAIVVYNKRLTMVIRRSSPSFNYLILGGAALVYVGLILFSMLEHTSQSSFCMATAWFVLVGFTTVFGALFAKTYRVHKIFNDTTKATGTVITNRELFTLLLGLVAIDVVLLTVWSVVDALSLQRVEDRQLTETLVVLQCQGSYTPVWAGLLILSKVVIICWGVYLAVKIRNVPMHDLNESRWISYAIYNVCLIFIIVIPVLFTIGGKAANLTAVYILATVSILFMTTVVVGLLFLPKLYLLFIAGEETLGEAQNQNVRVHRGRDPGAQFTTDESSPGGEPAAIKPRPPVATRARSSTVATEHVARTVVTRPLRKTPDDPVEDEPIDKEKIKLREEVDRLKRAVTLTRSELAEAKAQIKEKDGRIRMLQRRASIVSPSSPGGGRGGGTSPSTDPESRHSPVVSRSSNNNGNDTRNQAGDASEDEDVNITPGVTPPVPRNRRSDDIRPGAGNPQLPVARGGHMTSHTKDDGDDGATAAADPDEVEVRIDTGGYTAPVSTYGEAHDNYDDDSGAEEDSDPDTAVFSRWNQIPTIPSLHPKSK